MTMKKEIIQQEILLPATTSFSNREWCNKRSEKFNDLSPMEQLEEACWNGLLDESLPEIIEKSMEGKKLCLWHIRHGSSFLQIELCEFPQTIEKKHSIDAGLFLQIALFN